MPTSTATTTAPPLPGAAEVISKAGRRLERLLTGAALAGVVGFLAWTTALNSGFDNWRDLDYYQLLVRGWKKGQLHLDKEPAAELLALADPYDPNQNGGFKMGDASLFRNRYYIYFGAAPALTLLLPYSLITGREMTMGAATFVFATIAFLAASGLWLAIRRRYFPESRWWMAPSGVVALGFGTHLLALVQRPMIWELPISAGIAFTTLAVGAAFWAMHGRRPLVAMALAGLAAGLAVGSRPTCLVAGGLLLVPLWMAWREKDPRRVWWRMALAAALPYGACGLAIMAHNYARFGNILEWGQHYQLSGAYEGQLTHFSLRFFLHNFSVYFFQPLRWTSEFPFAMAEGIEIFHIPDYMGTEEVSGLAVTFPFYWFALALPLAWWRRSVDERWRLAAGLGVVAAYAVPVMLLVLCYFSTTMRYEADFAVALAVLAATGMLALERRVAVRAVPAGPAGKDGNRLASFGRWATGGLVIAACAATVFIGMLVSLDYHGRSMRVTAPQRWEAMQRVADGALAQVGLALGRIEGPRVLKVRFKPRAAGTAETFWQAVDPRANDQIVVEHIGEQLIRFGYRRGDAGPVWGRPLRWEVNHTHTVHVQVPSLYPAAGRDWWSGARRRLAFRERSCVAVRFSGGLALSQVVEPWPAGVNPGGAVGGDFSGEIREVSVRLFAADEIPAGLAEPHAARGGTLRMRVVFPRPLAAEGEPLFAAGAHYRSNILFVQPAPGGVKFAYENYSLPRVESAVVPVSPTGHVLELEMASFRPDAFGHEGTGDVVLRLDGREVIRTRQEAYPFPWGAEAIGYNPFGTTCGPEFTGWILDARWVRN